MSNNAIFDDKQAAFIAHIAEGGTWRSAAKLLGVSVSTISKWLKEDAELAKHYVRASETREKALFEELLEIADDGTNDWMAVNDPDNPGYRENGEAIRRSALRLETRKWVLSRMNRRVYGDKAEIAITHQKAEDVPDNELALIASGGRAGASEAEGYTGKPH